MPPSPQDHLACFLSQSSSSDKSGDMDMGKGEKILPWGGPVEDCRKMASGPLGRLRVQNGVPTV